jgi:glycogen debranching enzyme
VRFSAAGGPLASGVVMELPSVSTLHGLRAQARVEPATITLFRGWTRLTTDDHGEMHGAPLHGFFAAQTQFLTHYELRVNDRKISHRLSAQLAANEWSSVGAQLHSGDTGDLDEGTLPKGSIEMRLLRRLDAGWSELILLRNNGQPRRDVKLELRLCCPIREHELVEESGQERELPWTGLVPQATVHGDHVELRYHRSLGQRQRAPWRELAAMYGDRAPADGQRVTRGLAIVARVLPGAAPLDLHASAGPVSTLELRGELGGRQEARLLVTYEPEIDGVWLPAPGLTGLEPVPRSPAHHGDHARPVRVLSSNATLDQIVGQALVDLAALELPIFGPAAVDADRYRAFIAGVPRYIGLFGRDNLVTARQCPLFGTQRIEPVLARLGLLQGVQRDDWRDEEPGRLVHERRLSPPSQLGASNRELYYGDVTATPFWILALAELYRWTGERALLERQLVTLDRCCAWIMRRLEDGNGFIYYAPTAPDHENRNQAWKDSGDGIVDAHGRVCVPPLAVCEVQGYAYQALCETAQLLRVLGRAGGDRLLARGDQLKRHFNEHFWLPHAEFYALALDRDGRPIEARASNIGHCLGTEIIDDDKLASVVRTLLGEDMFSGWGIRTLSTHNPAYDPFSYHRGTVWPVENAMIAYGLRARGYHAEAERLTTAQLAVAALFQHVRLPEVFSGHARSSSDPVPGSYNFANLLQAWSVSAIARHIQSMLGVWPRADERVVYLDPHLPPWLAWVELHHLAVGGETISLRFWRESECTVWEAFEKPPSLELRSGRGDAAHTG